MAALELFHTETTRGELGCSPPRQRAINRDKLIGVPINLCS